MISLTQIPILNNMLFTVTEYDEINLNIVNLMDHFIETDPLRYSNPHFHSNLKQFVNTNILIYTIRSYLILIYYFTLFPFILQMKN